MSLGFTQDVESRLTHGVSYCTHWETDDIYQIPSWAGLELLETYTYEELLHVEVYETNVEKPQHHYENLHDSCDAGNRHSEQSCRLDLPVPTGLAGDRQPREQHHTQTEDLQNIHTNTRPAYSY